MTVEDELREATEKVLSSLSKKKLVVAGPGAGKTTLFRKLLEKSGSGRDKHLVITFVNNLKDDLERSLGDLSSVFTLHGYCQTLLHKHEALRQGLTAKFICYPGLISVIKRDWEWLLDTDSPVFVPPMRDLTLEDDQFKFYLGRSNYYDAIDYDDGVYRVYERLTAAPELIPEYELVLIDEFQDFNKMEAGIIAVLGNKSAITIAGDDDQALYSTLRSASWDYIRAHHGGGEYDVFYLPFCMRCPKVIVDAVNGIIKQARALHSLGGRIDKPYRYYEPKKGPDSNANPHIDLVRTSVQKAAVNYFGKYIEECVRAIPDAHAQEAVASNEPLVLIIGNKPYLPQVGEHLANAGLFEVITKEKVIEREKALELIKLNPKSNLGWRLILASGDQIIARTRVREADKKGCAIVDVFPTDERDAILAEAQGFAVTDTENADSGLAKIKLTSYESAKGLSAQYVFIVGLHENEMPRNSTDIKDMEICKFLVGLTRTKKKCTLMTTGRFGQHIKSPSVFIKWIAKSSFNEIFVSAKYWQKN